MQYPFDWILRRSVHVFFFFVFLHCWLIVLPCMNSWTVSRCHFVNCGGKDTEIRENKKNFLYEGDGDVQGGTANLYLNNNSYWGFSSTGDFMDDNNILNKLYTVSLLAPNVNVLDTTARIAPILLAYFFPCLENGQYSLLLRFAEIQFGSNNTYDSLGRRFFDVYVQVYIDNTNVISPSK